MCYNCGCGMPNDDMGQGHALKDANGKSITDETFKVLASQSGEDREKVMSETLAGLKQNSDGKSPVSDELYKVAADSQGMSLEEAKEETLKLLKKELKVS